MWSGAASGALPTVSGLADAGFSVRVALKETIDMKITDLFVVLLLTTFSRAATYYVSNAGNNASAGTNSGTSWAFAPGMSGCSSVCGSVTLQPGDSVLFNRGDSWR